MTAKQKASARTNTVARLIFATSSPGQRTDHSPGQSVESSGNGLRSEHDRPAPGCQDFCTEISGLAATPRNISRFFSRHSLYSPRLGRTEFIPFSTGRSRSDAERNEFRSTRRAALVIGMHASGIDGVALPRIAR